MSQGTTGVVGAGDHWGGGADGVHGGAVDASGRARGGSPFRGRARHRRVGTPITREGATRNDGNDGQQEEQNSANQGVLGAWQLCEIG